MGNIEAIESCAAQLPRWRSSDPDKPSAINLIWMAFGIHPAQDTSQGQFVILTNSRQLEKKIWDLVGKSL
jgi:hypothetical protein